MIMLYGFFKAICLAAFQIADGTFFLLLFVGKVNRSEIDRKLTRKALIESSRIESISRERRCCDVDA